MRGQDTNIQSQLSTDNLSLPREFCSCKQLSVEITSKVSTFHEIKTPYIYSCIADDCVMIFDSKDEFVEHQQTHKNLIQCNYPNCDKKFIEYANLKLHYKRHFPSKKKHFCPYPGCNKSFTASYNLTIHYRMHKGEQPYECEVCGKKFFDRANYKYHTKIKHVTLRKKDVICQHKNCFHKSKSKKQKLLHHDKLEQECKAEKNNLFNLLSYFQQTITKLEINLDEEGDEFKEEINNIKAQGKKLLDIAVDEAQYNGINCEL